MRDSPNWEASRAQVGFRLLFLLLTAWLAWCLVTVNIEFDDGYATLTNALYFLGDAQGYFSNRGPLMAFALIPAELIKRASGMHPLDVRVAHAMMAVAHAAYLIASWHLLIRVHGRDLPTLIGYAAAIATPVFFSYAPFLSLDIFPGVVALWMVLLVDQQLAAPTLRRWALLVALGVFLATLKQTYALVWVGIVLSLPPLLLLRGAAKPAWRVALHLLLAAAMSGLFTWMAYAAALTTPFGAEPFWIRPWLQIAAINSNYAAEGGGWKVFYAWIYLKNLWAYGVLAMLLVVPGLVLALLRGSSSERLVALVWMFMVVMLHLTPYKEVRYLAFLAPFNAVLLVPVVRMLWRKRRAYRWAVLVVLAVGMGLSISEALRVKDPYYRQALMNFLEPLPTNGILTARLIMGGPLSFVSPERQAYFGDRYHRITHITPGSIVSMYGYPVDRYWQINSTLDVQADQIEVGDIWLLTSELLVRTRPFMRGNREGLDADFFQLLAVAETISLEPEPGGYRIAGAGGQAPHILIGEVPGAAPFIAAGSINEASARQLFGDHKLAHDRRVTAFRVLRRCGLSDCRRFD